MDDKLKEALINFQNQHPQVTNNDLQIFILGWTEAVKVYFNIKREDRVS